MLSDYEIDEIGFALEDEGFSHSDIDAYLEHSGVKGMKWGHRKSRTPGVSRAIDKMAAKDAKEFARAKLYYGQGAGTRRKLIRETVNARKKHDPAYAKAFDNHSSKQDLSEHATKAVKERNRTDRTDRTKKRAGFVARKFTGEAGTQAAFTAAAIAGAAYLSKPQNRAALQRAASSITTSVVTSGGAARAARILRNFV